MGISKSILALCVTVLTACGGEPTDPINVSASNSAGSSSNNTGTVTSTTGKSPALGCSWPLVSNPDLINIFLPDKAATYWLAAVPVPPGTRLRINGHYPDSRYFSFTAYNALLDATDGLPDYKILPVHAGTSPFQNTSAKAGAPYVAYILSQPQVTAEKTGIRPDNTLYAGDLLRVTPDGVSSPVNPVTIFIYRLYVANGNTGKVPLPIITVEDDTSGESLMTLDMSVCQPLPPQGVPSLLNPAIANSSMPAPLAEGLASRPLPAFSQFPVFTKYYSLAETGREAVSNAIKRDLPIGGLTSSVTLNVAPNPDNKYMTSFLTRDKGPMYIIRGKAPVAAIKPSEAPLGPADLRYWSLCTNEPFSQRFVGCLYDAEIPVDEEGYFTLLVSDPDARPKNVVETNKMSWLPWGGPYVDSSIVYRHMLPSQHFKQAIQNIEYGADAAEVMGEYYPLISYCDRATIEAAGNVAKNIFKACENSRKPNE